MGMIPKDKGGGIFNLWGQWGKAKCQQKNPREWATNFLVSFTNKFNSHGLVGQLLPWGNVCMGNHQF